MIKIPVCARCRNFLCSRKLEGIFDEYGREKVLNICRAYPEGIPEIKWNEDKEECANGYCFEDSHE